GRCGLLACGCLHCSLGGSFSCAMDVGRGCKHSACAATALRVDWPARRRHHGIACRLPGPAGAHPGGRSSCFLSPAEAILESVDNAVRVARLGRKPRRSSPMRTTSIIRVRRDSSHRQRLSIWLLASLAALSLQSCTSSSRAPEDETPLVPIKVAGARWI